jgi:osmotically inducible protein OsmC
VSAPATEGEGLALPVLPETIRRRATARWAGPFPDGAGRLSTYSHALHEQPYSAASRFRTDDGVPGTNPEELLAAAHAACYSQALASRLTKAGYEPEALRVDAVVSLEPEGGAFSITRVELFVEACVATITRPQFLALAEEARQACPVTRALRATVTITATLL